VRLGLGLALCAACGSGARAADRSRVVRLGFFPNLTHAQAIYARAGGQFEQKIGVPIEWIPFNAGPTAVEALFADAVDATFVGPNPAVNGFVKSQGAKFVIVAGAASGGAGMVVRLDAGIASESDFAGKIIATPQLGNTQDVSARTWFAARGFKLKEKGGNLTLLPLSNADQLTLFRKKEIHGAWTVEPWVSRLEIEGGGKLFLDEKTLWPNGRYVTTQLVARKQFLAANPELMDKLLEGLIEVTQQINADKALQEAVVQRAMARVELTWDPIPASLRKCAAAAYEVGFLREPPKLDGIYALESLNRVLAAKQLPPVVE
jgi:NitT/TauT family transport system substrate-binding protein